MRKAMHILGILSDVDVDWLKRTGRKRTLEPGTLLVQQGIPMADLYLVTDGEMQVFAGQGNGVVLATLYAGEIIGEISFVNRRLPTASVRAVKPSKVLAIHRATLQEKLLADVGFASRFYLAIASFLAERLTVTTSRLGFGAAGQDAEHEEGLDDADMDEISIGTMRLDKLLRGDN